MCLCGDADDVGLIDGASDICGRDSPLMHESELEEMPSNYVNSVENLNPPPSPLCQKHTRTT